MFNLILRLYFEIFGYKVEIARFLPAIFNILSIFIIIRLFVKITKAKSYILIFTLLAFNIYLIKYSQELRLYSWYLFIFSLNIFLFYKIINNENNNYKSNEIFFLISSFLLILTHPFSLIIIFTYSLFIFQIYKLKKKLTNNLLIYIIIINVFSLVFLIFFILNTTHHPLWIESIDWKFFTNFFFSKFFGSRIVGVIYLLSFLYLVFKYLKENYKSARFELFLIYIVFFSYLIPIIYSYLFNPALVDRYIIYLVLIFILLISLFIENFKNRQSKIILSIILILITLGNFVTETTFKQFIFDRDVHKPDFKSSLKTIYNSNTYIFALNLEKTYLSKNEIANAFQAYIENYDKLDISKLKSINYLDFNSKDIENRIWIICLNDLNGKDCSLPATMNDFKIVDEYFYNSISLKLIEKII